MRLALRAVFVAGLAALTGGLRAEDITFEVTEPISVDATSRPYWGRLKFKCYLGCPGPGTWRINGNIVNAGTGWKWESGNGDQGFSKASETGTHPNFKVTTTTTTRNFTLENNDGTGWKTADTQTITIKYLASIKAGVSGVISVRLPDKVVVVSLKPGGPATGKTRVINGDLPANQPPLDEGELSDVFGYIPDYVDGVAQGAVDIPVGGKTLTIPPGGSWQRIRTNTGVASGATTPSWLQNGGRTARSGPGSGRGFFWSPALSVPGGDPPVPNGFMWGTGSGGSAWASAGPAGNTIDMSFPAGYNPKERDLRTHSGGVAGSVNVDPCFAHALDEADAFPPGMGPDDGQLPPGVTPGGTLPLPGLPVGPGIEPGVQLPPGVTPGDGGTGGGSGGGGGVSLPGGGGGGGGGGVVIGPPPPVAPDGKAPAEPGKGLPGDSAAQAHSDGLATKLRNAVSSVQGALEGLVSRGKVTAPEFGQANEWTFSFTLQGRQYVGVIPTAHAPLIRSFLLFVMTGFFLLACYKLLAGN